MRATATRPSTDAPARTLARLVRLGAIIAALAGIGLPASAEPAGTQAPQETVDTALVLAVDVSGSVNAERYALQMEGIAKAFEDPEVQRTLLSGPNRAMFVTLMEWSNDAAVTIPWTLIASAADASAFADKVRHAPRSDDHFTCLSRALLAVEGKLLPFAPAPADRTVVDVSGDGHDNCNTSPPVEEMRDRLVAAGVTINGLPILEGSEAATLEDWYREHLIGGNAAFLVPARGFKDFARAIRQKFLVETSSARTP